MSTETLSKELKPYTIETLKTKMCIPADASREEIEQTFERVAEVLKNNCIIKYMNEEYRILEFEFYFYNMNHQDISVHPRNSQALCWYINDFGGIDLNFESKINKSEKIPFKYELTDGAYFGGILIRQIQRLSDKFIYDGPLKVAELFRILDATTQQQQNPVLKMGNLDTIDFLQPQRRKNLLGNHKGSNEDKAKAKANYNLQECFTGVDDVQKHKLEIELASFCESKYRYCWRSS